MPHGRKRHLIEAFRKAAAHSPLVGVLGHRQVGKTTFLSDVSQHYLTLDDPNVLAHARLSSMEFVETHASNGVAIDECQLAPELFPALKEWVRTHKKPGQFYMSGSVRFTSRSAIRESLTGRILNVELFPFGLAELLGLPIPSSLLDLATGRERLKSLEFVNVPASTHKERCKAVAQYLDAGGLPGVCFVRDPKGRAKRIEEQLYTILDRDLRSVQPIKVPYRQILDFLREIASKEGESLNHSEITAKIGLSSVTQKKLLYALEAVFVLRIHPIRGERTQWTYLFEDQAEWRWFLETGANGLSDDYDQRSWNGLVYRNARLQSEYRMGERITYSGYATRSGVFVPLIISSPQGELGVLPILADEPSHRELMGAHSFLRKHPRANALFISKSARKGVLLDERIGIMPATHAFFE